MNLSTDILTHSFLTEYGATSLLMQILSDTQKAETRMLCSQALMHLAKGMALDKGVVASFLGLVGHGIRLTDSLRCASSKTSSTCETLASLQAEMHGETPKAQPFEELDNSPKPPVMSISEHASESEVDALHASIAEHYAAVGDEWLARKTKCSPSRGEQGLACSEVPPPVLPKTEKKALGMPFIKLSGTDPTYDESLVHLWLPKARLL